MSTFDAKSGVVNATMMNGTKRAILITAHPRLRLGTTADDGRAAGIGALLLLWCRRR
jgi:hypothetical protein